MDKKTTSHRTKKGYFKQATIKLSLFFSGETIVTINMHKIISHTHFSNRRKNIALHRSTLLQYNQLQL
jgi:hypothetical protein